MAKKEKAPKAAKAPKESKAGAGGTNFFQLHVEKMILGVIALVMAYLVYDGLGTKGVAENKNPENLTQTASTALNSVKEDHWKEIMVQPDRQYKAEFSGLARDSRTPMIDKPYETDPWEIAPRSISEKRGDPTLLAPINLQVMTGYGALAVNVKSDAADPFAEFEDAEEIKSRRRPPRNAGGRPAGGRAGSGGGSSGALPGGGDGDMGDAGGSSDLGGLMGGPMGGPGAGAGAGGSRMLNPQYDRGFGARGAQGGGMMGPGPMGAGSGGGDSGDLGAPAMGSGGRGGGPGGIGLGSPTGGSGGGATTAKGEKLGYKSVYFNVVSGVAPHKALVEEYKKAFEDSAGFNIMRDRPNYLSFIAERVDVTADPTKEPAEGDWKKITDLRQQEKLLTEWAGTNAEIVNFLYTDPELTIAPLPLLIRDYRPLVSHPDVPLSGKEIAISQPGEEQGKDDKQDAEGDSEEDQFSSRRRPNPGGGMMQGSGSGMGMPSPSGAGGLGMPTPGGSGGSSGLGMPTPGGRGAMGSGGMMGDGGDMGSSGALGGSGMPFGGNMFGGSSTSLEAESEYKLIRFYDFDIKPGHVYRYRIRLVIEDANYPEDRSMDLDLSIFKNEVFSRVVSQRAEDEKKTANKDGEKPRTFYRFTDWSQPSAPAYAPNPGMFANGEIAISKRTMNVTGADNKPATIEVDSSARGHLGNVVFADWDAALGVDVPTTYEAQKGTMLFFNPKDKEPEIVDPVTKSVKKLKGYKMNEAIAVVDVRGGENLAHNDDRTDRLTFSGEMLLFRNDGTLAVSDELDDQDSFRMFTFADEKEQADKSAAAPAGGGLGGGIGSPMGGGDIGSPTGGRGGR